MTLTGTSRGQGSTNTAGENTLVVTPGSNLTAGALAVLCVAYDNSGTNGADPFSSIVDSKGNTWTSRRNPLNDPGAANAGIVLRIFTSPQDVGALTTSDTITISFGGTTTVARSWTLQEFTSDLGKAIYITGGDSFDTSASPSITTGSILSGHAVVGAVGREGADVESTEDTDSSNGSWSTAQAARRGTTTAGSQICTQRKIVTGTGTQTYNPTYPASRDECMAWIEVGENVIVTPTTLAHTITTFAPTVLAPRLVTPGVLALALTTFAPVIALKIVVPAAALTLTTFAPKVGGGVVPTTAALAIATFAPTVLAPRVATPTTLALALTTFAPSVGAPKTITVPTASLAIATFAPTVLTPRVATATTLALTLATFAPTVLSPRVVTPSTLALAIATFAPTILAPRVVTPTTLAMAFTTFVPYAGIVIVKRRVTKHAIELAGESPAIARPRVTRHTIEAAALAAPMPVTPLSLPAVLASQLLANWQGGGVSLETSWRTSLFSGFEPCAEERVAQWGRPARTMTVRFSGIGREGDRVVSARIVMNALRHAQGRQPVPIYCDVSPLTEEAGGTVVPCDTRWRRFAPGARVLVHSWTPGNTHPGPYELAEVLEVLPDHLKLKSALGESYAMGAAFPVMDAELVARSTGRFVGPRAADFRMTFAEIPGASALPPSAQTWPAALGRPYLGAPIWIPPHEFSGGMTLEIVREGNRSDAGRSSHFAASGAVPRLVHGIDLRATSRATFWDFLRIFDGRQGMRKALWLVPPEHLFEIIAVGASSIDIVPNGNLADVQSFVRGIGVVFRTGGGFVRKVNGWSLTGGGAWRAALESAPPAFSIEDVAFTNIAHLVRFDDDALKEEWDTSDDVATSAKLIDLLAEDPIEVEHIEVFGPPQGPKGVAKGPPPADVDNSLIYLWLESTKNLYMGEATGQPTKPVKPCKADTPGNDEVDFWFDVRVQAGLLFSEGLPFPPPYLRAKWFGLSSDGERNPYLVNFKKWKPNKGRDIVEFCGTDAPHFVLQQESPTEKFWSDTEGLTIFFIGRFRQSEEHWIVDRPGVFRWRHDRVEFYESLGVVNAAIWFNHGDLRTKQLRMSVLRWIPGSDVRLWRAGKLVSSKTSNVATHLAGDDPGAETKIMQLEASVNTPGDVGHVGVNSHADAFVIFKKALSNSEINTVAAYFKKTYPVKWKALP